MTFDEIVYYRNPDVLIKCSSKSECEECIERLLAAGAKRSNQVIERDWTYLMMHDPTSYNFREFSHGGYLFIRKSGTIDGYNMKGSFDGFTIYDFCDLIDEDNKNFDFSSINKDFEEYILV